MFNLDLGCICTFIQAGWSTKVVRRVDSAVVYVCVGVDIFLELRGAMDMSLPRPLILACPQVDSVGYNIFLYVNLIW